MNRRTLLGNALALPLLAAPALLPALLPARARAQSPIRVTDLRGRTVTLPRPARRLVLAQARHVLAVGLLHPDPVSLLVGWGDDLRTMNPPDYAVLRARFPRADAIPVVARAGQNASLSLEAILAAQPDAVIVSGGALRAESDSVLDRLAAAGIPAIVIDFFSNPMRDTRRSMAILGQVLGLEERAAAFDRFYMARMERISARLAGLGEDRPRVFVHAHAGGTACCASPGRGAFDSIVRFAGGHNIGADTLPGNVGQLSLEYILSQDPAVYVATGGPYGGRGGIPLGTGVEAAPARRELAAVLQRERLDVLPAVQAGRAHAIWHGFNDTPAHIVMLEALARWFHPARCADLDPAATVAALNAEFLAIPMQGTYWTDLRGAAPASP
ncbi:ABC transporter substrate-binding protein [Teichococcus aestuarii]|uniref:ABC transporter substrate-binding protein n=1 Tax=Teichococcus aestuarii TaxID=568898 RepID=A0A2U1V0U2_9PROT|nr:ABC transporter substrate-binding protein [Pseudoroseomonas aestuarii]PWC27528.1 ABC transporter substrate-binding protein [Pseudoroseomonas aestuarii]